LISWLALVVQTTKLNTYELDMPKKLILLHVSTKMP